MPGRSPGQVQEDRIGRYELVGRLATGGMADVHLGRLVGPGGFDQPVVIKRILPHLARQRRFVEMFMDEARIASGIRHPNVVHVTELGSEGDELFLVMEYLEGEHLGGVTRRVLANDEGFDPALAAYIVAEACAGLHAAHELRGDDGKLRGVVHRDVSPQNLFLTYAGGVKVLDFGIAKAADRFTRTEAGQLKGKFEYMSPEQCRGTPLDRRSDVFALGILLHEMTTGRRLFKRAAELDTLKAICEEDVPPPSSLRPGYPKRLDAVCMRALARRPADRYSTAAEMRRELVGIAKEVESEVLPEEVLARRMTRLFPDRIEEKRDMLRKFRAGSGITSVPPAELDEPDTTEQESASVLRSVTDVPVEEAPRRSVVWRTVPWVASLAAIALTASALWLQRGPAASTAPAPPVTSVASSIAAPPEAAAPTPPAAEPAATHVAVHIDSTPAGATVVVDGELRGTTPLQIAVTRAAEPLELELRRDGFETLRREVIPRVDQQLYLSLRPTARPGARSPAAATARPRPAPRPDAGYFKFGDP
ncbi:MAG: serine/threonine-protein kinase [Polyangiaceae bacterium]